LERVQRAHAACDSRQAQKCVAATHGYP
jgi:hypothetical protein